MQQVSRAIPILSTTGRRRLTVAWWDGWSADQVGRYSEMTKYANRLRPIHR